MRKIALLFLAVLIPMLGMAQVEEWFEQGNAAYNEGSYEQALERYVNIENSGMESADLYYNMGNTYYKMKQFPMAILYYEKALKLAPGNEDIQTNLEIANLAVADKVNAIPQSFFARLWTRLKTVLSADGWAWVSVVVFGLLLLCVFVFVMARRVGWRMVGFFAGLFLLVCLALSVIFALDRYRDLKNQDEAIVMTPTINAKSSPSVNSVDLFVLHEGAKVRIMDSAMDRPAYDSIQPQVWNLIKLADGSIGWLPAESMTPF
jgi:tetratricopeptide (TPR) repeat protein